MPPNIQLNWIKRFDRAKQKQYFGHKLLAIIMKADTSAGKLAL